MTDTRPQLALSGLAQWEKQIIGCIFGSVNSRADVPMLLDLYKDGQLDLDGMVTSDLSSGGHQSGLPGHARRKKHPRSPRHVVFDMRAAG